MFIANIFPYAASYFDIVAATCLRQMTNFRIEFRDVSTTIDADEYI